jgi:hypothetical protein
MKPAPSATDQTPSWLAAPQRFGVLQRRSHGQSEPASVPPIVHEVLNSPGQPLDAATRAYMEPRFGHDFSKMRVHADGTETALAISRPDSPLEGEADRTADAVARVSSVPTRPGYDFSRVRIHADARAAESASAVQALAYTVGDHVVFGNGQYDQGREAGRRLLAHELTHTIQQRDGDKRIDRQSAGKSLDEQSAKPGWSDRVNAIFKTADGKKKTEFTMDEYVSMKGLVQEALEPLNVKVKESTNSESDDEAINKHWYVKVDSLGGPYINFDGFLKKKTFVGSAARAIPKYPSNPSGDEGLEVFIVFGPETLHPSGPEWTRAVFEHEAGHARHYIDRFFEKKPGEKPRRDTAGEHLEIYLDQFRNNFLSLRIFEDAPGSPKIGMFAAGLFENYNMATPQEQDSAFANIMVFYEMEIAGDECNVWKFQSWFRDIRAAAIDNPLVKRIYAAPQLKEVNDRPLGPLPKNCK